MNTVKTKQPNQEEVSAVVAKLKSWGIYTQLMEKDRADQAARRRAVDAKLKADLPLLEREHASAIKQREKAEAAMTAADQALTRAKWDYGVASSQVSEVSFRISRTRDVAEQKMRGDADPRIGSLHAHLCDLRDRCRHAFRSVFTPSAGFGRPSQHETNAAAVNVSGETIKALIAEVESLPLEDFSDDVGPRLASIAAKAAEAARAVGLHAEWELPS